MSKRTQCIASYMLIVSIVSSAVVPPKPAKADLWGGDVVVLTQILVQVITQVYKLQAILGKASDTVRILEEMNRGVKEVLKLADTAHAPLPPRVYEMANQIDRATVAARSLYGDVSSSSPAYARTNHRSAVEGLQMSQDAFDYSSYLDKQGDEVKRFAIVASPAAAARLTAQTLGMLVHSTNHTNRLQAKELELSSGTRLEETAKDNARYESYLNTHQKIENVMKASSFSSLNGMDTR